MTTGSLNGEIGECPVQHSRKSNAGECPVKHGKGDQAYDVYNRPIKVNPDNNMPFNPNQLPSPGQKNELPTKRVKSTIPKAGGDTWLFPSPQMFYNAMRRKGKTVTEDAGGDASIEELETEVSTVVAVHNNMNEKTWRQILRWESLHGGSPRLARFMGRPDDLTPKARLLMLLGWPTPFDRHDWFIKRGDKEVRYVIDYYYDESAGEDDQVPEHLHDFRSVKSITVDARPAIDSFGSLWDRIRMSFAGDVPDVDASSAAQREPSNENDETKEARETGGEDGPWDEKHWEPTMLPKVSAKFQSACAERFEKLSKCSSESECQKASAALSVCMASVVCNEHAVRFAKSPSDGEAYEQVTSCLERFEAYCQNVVASESNQQ